MTTCILTGDIVDAQGTPAVGVSVTIHPVAGTKVDAQGRLVATAAGAIFVQTNEHGHFEVAVTRLLTVRVVCEAVRLQRTITIPDQSTVVLSDLL